MAVSWRVYSVCLVMAFALLLNFTEGRDHLVAWKIPSSESHSLNKWAEKNRFQIGDFLVFKYESENDSVLEVPREAYLSCNNTHSAIRAYSKMEETRVELDHSGPYYFISGSKPNCAKGEKLIVVVMAAREVSTPALAPSPAFEYEGPAVSPTSAGSELKLARVMMGVGVLAGFLM